MVQLTPMLITLALFNPPYASFEEQIKKKKKVSWKDKRNAIIISQATQCKKGRHSDEKKSMGHGTK